MVGIAASADSTEIMIFGHGLTVAAPTEIEAGVWVTSELGKFDTQQAADCSTSFGDYAAAVYGSGIATFGIRVVVPEGGQALVAHAWNSLWLFHLLALASERSCLFLYAVSDGERPTYSRLSPNLFAGPMDDIGELSTDATFWLKKHSASFHEMIRQSEFSTPMRCYSNSFYLPDNAVRIMLLWAGIEGLLSVDGELSRRIALYSAQMLQGSAEEKVAFFDMVKKAYGVRSRTVHGSTVKASQLAQGRLDAEKILVRLLRRCIELGRVPKTTELDRLAASSNVGGQT